MNMEIILKDGSVIYPSYAPEHRQPVLEFYAKLFEQGELLSWKVI
jgi:hypothetical protein